MSKMKNKDNQNNDQTQGAGPRSKLSNQSDGGSKNFAADLGNGEQQGKQNDKTEKSGSKKSGRR